MKCFNILVLCAIIATPTIAHTQSFLTATKFPKSFNDLDFTTRMNILAQGYEPWESEYDTNGRCISNCAYDGITLQSDIDKMARQTEISNQYIAQTNYIDEYYNYNKNSHFAKPISTGTCSSRNNKIPPNQIIPIGSPLAQSFKITSPYNPRRIHPVTGNASPHRGVDFVAPTGTAVYSPAMGTVSAVWTDKTCGRGIRISHYNGYETEYCHLSQQNVNQGDKIGAGCIIGHSGNTGRSTGAHLHYAIKHNGTHINPADLLVQD